jgi:hypothetical protein
MVLMFGANGIAVKNLQSNLTILGLNLEVNGVFDETVQKQVIAYQSSRGLKTDGVVGAATQEAIAKDLITKATQPKIKTVPINTDPTDEPVWVKWFEDRLGWNETKNDKELSKGWKYTNVPFYKSVKGKDRSWCAMSLCTALEESGYEGTHDAAAASFSFCGVKCGFIKGALLPIRHKNGGRHVNIFLYWVDEKQKLAMCLGGNQGNAISKAVFNLSGNDAGHDEIVNGPRWPSKK